MAAPIPQRDDDDSDEPSPLEAHIQRVDRFGLLFGEKLAASMSPLLHNVVYRSLHLQWEQLRLDSNNMDLFLRLMRHPKFYGASVTMPHKVAIMPHLDELEPSCRDVGACNTVFLRAPADPARPGARPRLCGANTDVVGVREAFLQNVAAPARAFEGRPALVVGGGGAARSAVYALRTWLRARAIYLVNRDAAEVDAVVAACAARGFGRGLVPVRDLAQARALEGPGAVVACIPDLPPRTEEEKLARSITLAMLRKPHKGAMLEMCYNPSPHTELGALAEAEGWQVILGTEALIWQGVEQDKHWTGREVHELPIRKVQETIAARVMQHSKL
ncbi:hypothetical protein P8C59_005846 [Phyllachora maydis]|uniref:Shikimate dehydrogenase substrate binding N-terminal domain-containing protein n=1 Tax=Phyllachora maydis TaxID=1825666 RepID=A0AAD9MEX2_9PEZI|nr:hypothetical protein P8C59_005846 [Phyllachora maydis]